MRISNPVARKGEDLACEYLKKKGYKIIERNFRKSYGEIDIIAIYRNILVFIEVKTRTNDKFGSPLESITQRKLRLLTRTAQVYKSFHPTLPDSLRIDGIAILIEYDLSNGKIEHIENISSI